MLLLQKFEDRYDFDDVLKDPVVNLSDVGSELDFPPLRLGNLVRASKSLVVQHRKSLHVES